MKRVWALTPLIVGLLGIGLETWAAPGQGYPRAVYYQRVTTTTTGAMNAPPGYEQWLDPSPLTLRTRTFLGTYSIDMLVRDAKAYDLRDPSQDGQPLSADDLPTITGDWQGIGSRGFQAIGAYLLSHAHGPVTRAALAGRRVLRFATVDLPPGATRRLVWLDAGSQLLVQSEWDFPYGSITYRYSGQRVLPPHGLRATFFSTPTGRSTIWQRLRGWIGDRLGRGAG